MGWGLTAFSENSSLSDVLRYANVTKLSYDECFGYYNDSLSDGMFCAIGLHNNADAHQGDSGGPIVCNGRLGGITSFGYSNLDTPGVYADISRYLPFIEKHSSLNFSRSSTTNSFNENSNLNSKSSNYLIASAAAFLLLGFAVIAIKVRC